MRAIVPVIAMVAAVAGGIPHTARADAGDPERKLYVVGVSHLDTQWYFNIQETISVHIPETFGGTFALFEKVPEFNFSWEGAYRYMLLEEYYPGMFEELKQWVDLGRWAPGGSSLEAGDVNVPSPESLVRHFLIGTRYFREKLGRASKDVFLPDCFGFGHALPTVAAHCGLTGFSTQKLGWGSVVDIPFGIGRWQGVDGSSLVAALKLPSYTSAVDHDLSYDQPLFEQCSTVFPAENLALGTTYFGVGDEGGPVKQADAEWVHKSVLSDGPIQVLSAFSDQLFADLTPGQVAQLPSYNGELLLTTHGTGSYTSQGAMKRWNRNNELIADAAERAWVLADWLGLQAYPAAQLHATWIRFLAQHFHDVLPGTSTADVYLFAWNDELLALNRFSALLTDAVGALARALDTQVEGTPLVVFNPLALQREDPVRAFVRYPAAAPANVTVLAPEGTEVPSQILSRGDDWLEVLFLAKVKPVGLAVFDVRESSAPCSIDTGLVVADRVLESGRYRVEISESGDIASIKDKSVGKELLSAPVQLALWDNNSSVWPAWELLWSDLSVPAREVVAGPAEIAVVESGPARIALEIRRTNGASTYVQHVRLAAGTAGDRIEVVNRIDWHTPSSTLKAVFPLAAANPKATYDLGVGTVARGNATDRMYEVPAQQWADLTATDGSFGVTVSNDCKYGWDKPDDATLRLTLVNTPLDWPLAVLRYGQHTQDLGPHVITFAIHGHTGDWKTAAWPVAARVNQPVLAFQTQRAQGPMGRELSAISVAGGDVAVKAVKRAEDADGYVVRLVEMAGTQAKNATLTFGNGIQSAEELNGIEDPLATATVKDGALRADFAPFQMRTFRIRPAKANGTFESPASRVVPLDFNVDVMSLDSARGDGVMGKSELGKKVSLPGELIPESLVDGGIEFALGSSAAGALNAVECHGQTVPLPALHEGDRLFVLAAALDDEECTLAVGGQSHTLAVQKFTGQIGSWVGRVLPDKPLDDPGGFLINDPAQFLPPFYKQDRIAWYTTHRHLATGDDPYKFTYLFRYELPVPEGATSVTLPDKPACRIFAMTLSAAPGTRVLAASRLFAEHDPLAQAVDWSVMNPAEPETPPDPQPETAEDASSLDSAAGDGGPGGGPGDGGPGDGGPGDGGPVDGASGRSGGCSAGSAGSGPATPIRIVLLALALLACRGEGRGRRAGDGGPGFERFLSRRASHGTLLWDGAVGPQRPASRRSEE
jgi:alpha-mannosidase